MGEVWLARHRLLRRDAAVKLVLAGLLERAGDSERAAYSEALRIGSAGDRIVALAAHGGDLRLTAWRRMDRLYYAMEYLQGLDAEVLVDRYGPQPAGRVICVPAAGVRSLEEAHDAGMVHRDIKGSNVFVCRLGKQRRFRQAAGLRTRQRSGRSGADRDLPARETSGTPAFMAPEQVRGEDIDARADIYGLGCLAYFLLTGIGCLQQAGRDGHGGGAPHEQPEPPSMRSELPIPESLERVVMAVWKRSARTGRSRWPSLGDAGRLHRLRALDAGRREPLVGAAPARAGSKDVVMSGGAAATQVRDGDGGLGADDGASGRRARRRATRSSSRSSLRPHLPAMVAAAAIVVGRRQPRG